MLAVLVSLLIPHPEFGDDNYTIKIIHRLSVPDNNHSWQVFRDDAHINSFLQSLDKFASNYFEGSQSKCHEFCLDKTNNCPKYILHLKGNVIAKGLVDLEKLFDKRDSFTCQTTVSNDEFFGECKEFNIRDERDPKLVSLGVCCDVREKAHFTKFLKEYRDIFGYSYEDLKTFRDKHFKHHIPLKFGTYPFKQKLRTYNMKVSDATSEKLTRCLRITLSFPFTILLG